jgi:hypothetical protein
VEFQDGTVQEYAANLIAEAIFAQVDDEGRQFALIDSIIDHQKDGTAVSRDDMYVQHAGNNRHMRRTTKGWKLLVQWKDGTTTWVPLKDLKESNPVEVAQYPKTKKKWDIPTHYLGANIGQYAIEGTGRPKGHWYMSADDYVKAAINNVETELAKNNEKLPSRADCVISPSYRPELDVSPLLDAAQANYYQNLIGVLRWAMELGRIDIFIAVSLLSQYLASPRQGHLEQVFRIFAYLKAHSRSKVVFDDTFIAWRNTFQQVNWEHFYPDALEPVPSSMPEARGPEVQINCFVDANHAGNVVTRWSHTGVLIFLNKAPIVWYLKRQNTVESSTFGSEFVALKIATELVQGLRFKLRMMGVALDGPANVFCDNKSVVINSSVPESTLKKKHVSICYHRVREACAMGMVRIAHEGTHTNLADCLTKVLPGVTHAELIKRILY